VEAIAAVILAVGESRRMGRPKALLPVPGSVPQETFLDRLIGLFSAQKAHIIVVLGAHSDAIRAGAARAEQARFVVNPRPQDGQLSSLQCGLREAPEEAAGVLFTPVDFPRVSADSVAGLVAAFWRGDHAGLVIPRFQGRRGRRGTARAAARGGEAFGARASDVIHRHAAEACYVDVDDPEAYRALAELE
jgi:molybdenum cofactor cytidylyltransferase